MRQTTRVLSFVTLKGQEQIKTGKTKCFSIHSILSLLTWLVGPAAAEN